MANPITKNEVMKFAEAWFRALGDHAPVQECYKMLASDGLEMYFPDTVIWNLATFKEWYDGVIDLFFDEKHCDVRIGEPRLSGEQAEVDLVVRWQASWWESGTAKSKRVNLVATQKWRVRRTSKNAYGLEIVYYNAEAKPFKFESGSDPLPPGETKMTERQESSLRTAYQELCNSYRAIDDFRAKLLGFLPLASGTGIFLLLGSALGEPKTREYVEQFMGSIGAFGFVVTLGLFAYEIYGIKKCGALIEAGKQIEGQLHVDGQFVSRPRGVGRYINEPFAAGIIYPAVLAAWMFLALAFTLSRAMATLLAIEVFLAGFVGMLLYNWWLDESRKREERRLDDR